MNTLPMTFWRGTGPQTRESHDCERLSPMTKYLPGGTLNVSSGADVATVVLDVRLLEPLPVDVDVGRATSQPYLQPLAGEADDALHERAPCAALRLRGAAASRRR